MQCTGAAQSVFAGAADEALAAVEVLVAQRPGGRDDFARRSARRSGAAGADREGFERRPRLPHRPPRASAAVPGLGVLAEFEVQPVAPGGVP